jgi:hypothetical protein
MFAKFAHGTLVSYFSIFKHFAEFGEKVLFSNFEALAILASLEIVNKLAYFMYNDKYVDVYNNPAYPCQACKTYKT